MVKPKHSAQLFMGLYCSKSSSVVLISVIVTIIPFVLLLLSSLDFTNQYYDDPSMFKPVAQDYFRTILLGLFSPPLIFIIKRFALKINEKKLVSDLIFDFFINDWIMLLIIVCLAYPQVYYKEIDGPMSFGDDYSSYEWHVIPKQSYLFGISWSISELIIAIALSIPNFRTVNLGENGEDYFMEPDKNLIHDVVNDNEELSARKFDDLNERSKITLSRCIDIRNHSSTLSNNIYNSTPNKMYGSTAEGAQKTVNVSSNGVISVDSFDNTFTTITFVDKDLAKTTNLQTSNDNNSSTTSLRKVEYPLYFCSELQDYKHLIKRELLLLLVVSNFAILTVGEALIMSIYFIFVRGHENLFSKVVNYFGVNTINFFLGYAIFPYTIIMLVIAVIIYFWTEHDQLKKFNEYQNSLTTDDQTQPKTKTPVLDEVTRPYTKSILELYDTATAPPAPNERETNLITTSGRRANLPMELRIEDRPTRMHMYNDPTSYYPSNDHRPKHNGTVQRLLHSCINSWKSSSKKVSFTATLLTAWSVATFVVGLLSVIPPPR